MNPSQLASDLAERPLTARPITERAEGAGTYLAEDEKGRRWALKLYGPDHTAYRTERETLQQLERFDAPTPRVVAADEESPALLLSWHGDRTLDQVISARSDDPLIELGLRALIAVELVFAQISGPREESDQIMVDHLRRRDEEDLLRNARACRLVNPDLDDAEDLLRPIYEIAWQGSWNYGSLDCSASNLVTDGESVTVIDFSVLGAEWVERRLASYLIASGARGVGQEYVCAITGELVLTLIDLFDFLGGGGYRPELIGIHRFLALLALLERLDRARAEGAEISQRRWRSVVTALAEPVARPEELSELAHEMELDRR